MAIKFTQKLSTQLSTQLSTLSCVLLSTFFLFSSQSAHAYAESDPYDAGSNSVDDGYTPSDLSGGDDSYYSDQPVAGVYFGATGGMTDFDVNTGTDSRAFNSETYAYTTDTEKFMGNIHAGNLWGVNQAFSVGMELGATYWGSYDFKGTNGTTGKMSFDQETINALLGLQWNMTSRIFLMPQIGVAFNFSGTSGSLSSADGTAVEGGVRHKATPLLGLNIGFNCTPALSVYLSGQELLGDTPSDSDSDALDSAFSQNLIRSTTVSLGLNYNIGQ